MQYDRELFWAAIITVLIITATIGLTLLFLSPEELTKLGATYEH